MVLEDGGQPQGSLSEAFLSRHRNLAGQHAVGWEMRTPVGRAWGVCPCARAEDGRCGCGGQGGRAGAAGHTSWPGEGEESGMQDSGAVESVSSDISCGHTHVGTGLGQTPPKMPASG